MTVEVKLSGLKIGDLCYIEIFDGKQKPAEVAAFKGEVAQLLLLLDGSGIGQGSLVTSTGRPITTPVEIFYLADLSTLLVIQLRGNLLMQQMHCGKKLKALL